MDEAIKKIQIICDKQGSRSQVFRSGSHGHLSCIRHHYASSSQDAKWSVEPGSTNDLAEIMKVINEHDVRFAIKSGGHATNPEFSSTEGIHISMSRFNRISHNASSHELTVGAGCLFDEIYKFIRPRERNIVGGGGSVGIAGWMMGGGYSLKTSQHGIGVDSLVEAEIVTPNGDVVRATEESKSDLFWAIKGGGNNFGIATEFVVKTHSQGRYVYGGLLSFGQPRVERVKQAIVRFMAKDEPKAAIVAAFRYYRNRGVKEFKFTVLTFYDGSKPDPDPFADFLAIPRHDDNKLTNSAYVMEPESTLNLLYDYMTVDEALEILSPQKSDYSFPSSEIAGISIMNARARWGNVMVSQYTLELINTVEEEAKAAEELMDKYKGKMVVVDIWPFRESMFRNSKDSAWPRPEKIVNGEKVKTANGPLLVYFMWEGEENDKRWIKQMKVALDHIHQVALQQKCTTLDAPVYCNTTLADTTPEQIYRNNLNELSALRRKYDPGNAMKKTGGFRIPHDIYLDGSYTISNAKHGKIGVANPPRGPIITADSTTFEISHGEGGYKIKIGNYAVHEENTGRIICEQANGDTWEIFPEVRKNNQLGYRIANSNKSKCWVQESQTHVKCSPVVRDSAGNLNQDALWRFERA